MKNNTILIVIGIALVLLIGFSVMDKPKDDGLKMGVILYDKYGDEIKTIDQFAIVGGVPGVSSLAIKAEVQNIGDIPLDCYIEGTSHILEAAFNENYIYLGESIPLEPYTDWYTWTSAPMNADDLIVGTINGIYTFSVWVACYDLNTGGAVFLESKQGELQLSIEPDYAGFNVNVRY